ncbi:MAG: hypothetical protein V3T65_08795 [Acidobacteriota bacterium]
MLQAGRSIGLAASVVTGSLWLVFLFFNPYGNRGINMGTYAIAGMMLGLALVGAVAAWKGRPIRMFVVFALSFVPVGFYTLGAPGLFRWVGISNALFLVSGLLMLAKRKPIAA